MPALTFIALMLAAAPAVETAPPRAPSRHIAGIIARSQGVSAETAYRVRSVREEYQVVHDVLP